MWGDSIQLADRGNCGCVLLGGLVGVLQVPVVLSDRLYFSSSRRLFTSSNVLHSPLLSFIYFDQEIDSCHQVIGA
jgi:hypothetical protein